MKNHFGWWRLAAFVFVHIFVSDGTAVESGKSVLCVITLVCQGNQFFASSHWFVREISSLRHHIDFRKDM